MDCHHAYGNAFSPVKAALAVFTAVGREIASAHKCFMRIQHQYLSLSEHKSQRGEHFIAYIYHWVQGVGFVNVLVRLSSIK